MKDEGGGGGRVSRRTSVTEGRREVGGEGEGLEWVSVRGGVVEVVLTVEVSGEVTQSLAADARVTCLRVDRGLVLIVCL